MSSVVTEAVVAVDDGLVKERRYWRDKLAVERRPCGLRSDHRRGDARHERSARRAFDIAGDLYERLHKLTGGEPFLEYAALTAALTACLYRYTQASPVVVGCPPLRSAGEAADPHNAIALVNDVQGQMTFRQLLLGVRRTLIEAHEHQAYPYGQLLEDLGLPVTPNRCPLFDVALEHREMHHGMPEMSQDFTWTWAREPGRLEGAVTYSPGLYEAATIERFGRHLLNLLRHGLEDAGVALAELEMLTGEERRQMAVWNDTAHPYPRDRAVHELFEEQVERAPDSTALAFGDHRLSHRELDERANRLAHHLQKLGVVANAPVGICLDRSAELVVAMLGVLKAGGAYVPYDPTYPRERMAAMFDDVKLKVLLTREALVERLPEHKLRVVCLDRDWGTVAGLPADKAQPRSGPGDLCYIVFTSGSTGRPKAPAIYHRGWTNLLWWFGSEFAITPRDRTLVMSSISFDLTQRAIAMPLVTGGELHLAADGYDPELILLTLGEQQITLMNCAPSTFYPLLEGPEAGSYGSLASLRCLFLGGEAISASRLKRWATAPGGRTPEIANVYGAAESSDVTSFYRLHDFDRYIETSVPIGKPIYNSQVYIVDEDLRLMPIGAAGEICLGGDGVGRGYVNDPVLTSRKFVEDPFSAEAGARLYRTGDLGRYLANGDLEFLGRVDHQVKIRGLRIELGEIETLLRAEDAVTEAVAVAAEYAPGDRRLTAYYVSSRPAGTDEQLESELREALAKKLPAAVIPNVFVRLAEMPLNPNGKIDRGALPLPVPSERRSAAAAPRNPIERAVAKLFSEILNVEEVGFSDDFFRLGGHSLMATQMIARLSEIFDVRFTAVDFFARPTVAALAERVEAIRRDAPAAGGPATDDSAARDGAPPQ